MEFGKVFFIFIFLAVFTFLGLYGLQGPWRREISDFKEGFAASPTRASDCRCNPGYIPSNIYPVSSTGGRVIRVNGGPIFLIPNGSKVKHRVPSCSYCEMGINFCDPTLYTEVTEAEANTYQTGPTLTCEILKETKEKKVSETYFCQSMSKLSDTDSCY